MSVSKNEAIEMFVEIVEMGECPDDSLDKKHIYRGYKIDKLNSNKFQISIERHPHLFGKPSIGFVSSAFARVRRTYELDTDEKKIDFVGEDVEDFDIDYYSLAGEDVEMVIDNMPVIESVLVKFDINDEVKMFAGKEFEQFNWLACYESNYDLPIDFEEKMLSAIKETFIERIFEEWEKLKE